MGAGESSAAEAEAGAAAGAAAGAERAGQRERGQRQWRALEMLALDRVQTPESRARLARASQSVERLLLAPPEPLPDYFVWEGGYVELATRLMRNDPSALDRLRSKVMRKAKVSEEEFWKRYLLAVATEYVDELRALMSGDVEAQYARELPCAIAAVRRACAACRAARKGIETLEKTDRSPVTAADYASQAIICSALRAEFPDDPIVAEEDAEELQKEENAAMVERVLGLAQEAGVALTREQLLVAVDSGRSEPCGTPGSRYWTLDPIDGTLGFLRGGQYAVCLALVVDGRVVLGVLGCPSLPVAPGDATPGARLGSLFYAMRGAGAYALPVDAEAAVAPESVQVSSEFDPAHAVLVESVEAGHSSHDHAREIAAALGATRAEPLRMDSQCKYAAVARGEASVYLRLPTRADYAERIWDHAAGALLVEEAGGAVTDVRGEPLWFATSTRGLARNSGVIATNGVLHAAVVEAAGRVLAPSQRYAVTIDTHNKWGDRVMVRAAIASALGLSESAVSVEYA
eukprot:m51a1_g8966 putative 3 (2 ) -bisphosphate nucleotidase (518) ;mRNA; f:1072750-1074484